MRMYMGYNEEIGSEEGAVLVFANDESEAQELVLSLKSDIVDFFEQGDVPTVRELLNSDYLGMYRKGGLPQVLTPPCCDDCLLWGVSLLDKNNLCEDCR